MNSARVPSVLTCLGEGGGDNWMWLRASCLGCVSSKQSMGSIGNRTTTNRKGNILFLSWHVKQVNVGFDKVSYDLTFPKADFKGFFSPEKDINNKCFYCLSINICINSIWMHQW